MMLHKNSRIVKKVLHILVGKILPLFSEQSSVLVKKSGKQNSKGTYSTFEFKETAGECEEFDILTNRN